MPHYRQIDPDTIIVISQSDDGEHYRWEIFSRTVSNIGKDGRKRPHVWTIDSALAAAKRYIAKNEKLSQAA